MESWYTHSSARASVNAARFNYSSTEQELIVRTVQAYLDGEGILALAKAKGADAIHPGYGFLAENAHFNEVCRSSGFEFIGPIGIAAQHSQ